MIKNNEVLLKIIEDLGLDDTFINLKIYLLEFKGDFIQSFRLHMNNTNLRKNIFGWIDKKLS